MLRAVARQIGGGYAATFTSLTLTENGNTILTTDAANTLAQRNGTNTQAFRVYNTFTDASNYQRVQFRYVGGEAVLEAVAAGTGSAHSLVVAAGLDIIFSEAGVAERWKIKQGTGHIFAATDNVSDIGATGATRPRTGYFGTGLLVQGNGGVGYGAGAGGTVTQLTNKATAVTLNNITGQITLNAASLSADTTVSFSLNNTAISATDAVIVLHESTGTLGAYNFASTPATGSATVAVHNNTPGILAEAIVLRYVVIKSVNA